MALGTDWQWAGLFLIARRKQVNKHCQIEKGLALHCALQSEVRLA